MSDLFGSDDEDADPQDQNKLASDTRLDASLTAPFSDIAVPVSTHCQPLAGPDAIDGLYLFRALIPSVLQTQTTQAIIDAQAISHQHPQAMIFPQYSEGVNQHDETNCPEFLVPLYKHLRLTLRELLSEMDYACVFDETLALQTIVNLYAPGQGISPHIDLPHRYAEPIIGISFCSSCIMDLVPVGSATAKSHAVLLRPGDVYIMLRFARYDYKHGIEYRLQDQYINDQGQQRTLIRGTRISVTFRRMLGASALLTRDA